MSTLRIDIAYPFDTDVRGRTALASYEAHVRDMIEQVLFTSPGERVNRADFGVGLMQLVFKPAGDELVTAMRALVQGNLTRWLGSIITADGVDIVYGSQALAGTQHADSSVVVTVQYTILATGAQQTEQFAQ
jgi:uncharacterized protein